jgi:hypothetical protein
MTGLPYEHTGLTLTFILNGGHPGEPFTKGVKIIFMRGQSESSPVIGRISTDVDRFQVYVSEAPKEALESKVAHELWNLVSNLSLSAIPNGVDGCDGWTTTLRLSSGFNNATYSWWCDLPENWSDLQPLLDALEPLLPADEPDPLMSLEDSIPKFLRR